MQRTSRPGRAILSLGAVVWLLGLTQNIGYGTLYYSFAILAGDAGAEFGRPVSWIFGAFSLALLVGSAAAPSAGRWIDRYGAARVMSGGSLGAALSLALLAWSPNEIVFVLGLVAIQVISVYVLYEAAFTLLVQIAGADAKRRILHLTLIAGFASTMFWPLTSWLHTIMTWREVVWLFAGMNLCLCLPAHLWLARSGGFHAETAAASAAAATSEPPLPAAMQMRAMVLMTIGFAVGGMLLSAILAQMVPMLNAVGLGTAAVLVSMLFGPSQVLVRFVNMAAASGRHPLSITIIASTLLPVAVAILTLTAPAAAGAAVFAVLLGFGSGLLSIVRGTLPLALFGSGSYGARLGRIASARMVLAAIAPFALAFMIDTAGPITALASLIVTGVLALLAFLAVQRMLTASRTRAAAVP